MSLFIERPIARSSASATMIESIFAAFLSRDIPRARARACLHPCKCWPQQRLKDCTEVFVARDLRSFNIAYAIHTPESPLLIDADGRNKHVVQWCGTVCSCFSSIRINFRRNNERGQKLSGRSFIEQDATGRVHSSATNTSASPIKITIRKTANYIFFSLFFLWFEERCCNTGMEKGYVIDIIKWID